MAQAAQFPLYLPPEARRPFASEEVVRRLVRVAQLDAGSRVLSLGGAAVLPVASVTGASVVVVEPEEAAADRAREQVVAAGLTDRVEVRRMDLDRLPFRDGEFQAVLVLGHVLMPFELTVRRLRRFLSPSEGRLAVTYPARVGRQVPQELQTFWRDRLGEPLRAPRELLTALERTGFECEDAFTLDDRQLDEVYATAEAHLEEGTGLPVTLLQEEIALHRAQAGRASTSYTLLVGRRREPGESPFTSRDRG